MKKTAVVIFAVCAGLFMLSVVAQTFLAGMGVFGDPDNWRLHKTFVTYFDKLTLVMFAVSFLGGIRGWMRWLCLVMFGLVILQYISVNVFSSVWMIAAFHPVNALLLFWASLYLFKRSLTNLGLGRSR